MDYGDKTMEFAAYNNQSLAIHVKGGMYTWQEAERLIGELRRCVHAVRVKAGVELAPRKRFNSDGSENFGIFCDSCGSEAPAVWTGNYTCVCGNSTHFSGRMECHG